MFSIEKANRVTMETTVTTVVLRGLLDVNCYFLEKDGHCLIVDPGCEKERLIAIAKERQVIVEGILLTHGHFDHTGAIEAFSVPIYCHQRERAFITNDEVNGYREFGIGRNWDPSQLSFVFLEEGAEIPFCGTTVRVIHTPGHTPGSACYLWGKSLFSGDTLFQGGVGRWDFPGGDYDALRQSVVRLISTLDPRIFVYPGHGEPTTIGDEGTTNDYYLQWRSEVYP